MKTYVLTSTLPHVYHVANNMRKADIEELTAVGNVSPETALMSGYLESKPYCYTGMKDGTPFTMFGVVPMDRELKTGSIWLLATNDLTNDVPISFLRQSRKFLPTLLEPYDMVFNCVYEQNTVHIKWIQWLGFTFIRRVTLGPYNKTFLEFARLNHV